MSYMQEVRMLLPVDVNEEALVTLSEAAKMLKVTVQAVAGAVGAGSFKTVIVNTDVAAGRGARGRRLLLRVEVMERVLAF